MTTAVNGNGVLAQIRRRLAAVARIAVRVDTLTGVRAGTMCALANLTAVDDNRCWQRSKQL
jgi:hypothetical protein